MNEMIERNEAVLKRMHEALAQLDPNSDEFKELLNDIKDLTKIQAELKKYRPEFWLKIFGIAAPIAASLGMWAGSVYIENSPEGLMKPKSANLPEKWITPYKKS